MVHKNLQIILACYSIAGLLTATVFSTSCSKQEEADKKPIDQKTSQQQSVIVDDDLEKPLKPEGEEVKIRGDSG